MLLLQEKETMSKKLDVLTSYFNKRESDLQKQLGMTSNRLSDTATTSESAAKQIFTLTEEVGSYKAQLRTIKIEMEDQERSLKTQV
jgi:flagellar biosynthesis chaperone FliJ